MIKKTLILLLIIIGIGFTYDVGYELPFEKSDYIKIHKDYGLKINPIITEPRPSQGIIFELREGSKISAINDGNVLSVYASGKGILGNYVKIKHNDSIIVTYYHLKNINISKGKFVQKGQIIGLSGNSGLTTVNNGLGIMIERKGDIIDPKELIRITEYNK